MPIIALDQKTVLLHMDWDDTNLVLQNEQQFSGGEEENAKEDWVQVWWQGILTIIKEDLKTMAGKRTKGQDVIIVLGEKDLMILPKEK